MSDPTTDTPLHTTDEVTSTGGLRLGLHDFGGTGRNVLAAHATGFNGLVWAPLAAALAGHRVVAPDFRAHGASPVPRDADLDWDRFADDVLATLATLGWSAGTDPGTDREGRPVGIGHSMGGAALLLAELRRPGTFAGLWVYEPIVFPPEVRAMASKVDNPLSVGARRRRATFPSRAEAQATYASKPPMNTFAPEALAAYVDGGFTETSDGTVRLACVPEDEARIYTTASTCTAFERLGSVECPVTVVRGALAEFTPAGIAGSAAEALPNGRLVAHDELSHFGPMEDPVGLAAEIAAFTADLDD